MQLVICIYTQIKIHASLNQGDVVPHAKNSILPMDFGLGRAGCMTPQKVRCPWSEADPIMREYHDLEWGVPIVDDRKLFEFLVLEGAQAGLSWLTILKRREGYRRAFANFDAERVARFKAADVRRLLKDVGIIRNRLKIISAIKNATAFLQIQKEFGSFARYQWSFVDGKPLQNQWKTQKDFPARTDLSDAWSKDLKKRGFSFVGSTILYAHMQAVGMVNDHLVSCFRHEACAKMSKGVAPLTKNL